MAALGHLSPITMRRASTTRITTDQQTAYINPIAEAITRRQPNPAEVAASMIRAVENSQIDTDVTDPHTDFQIEAVNPTPGRPSFLIPIINRSDIYDEFSPPVLRGRPTFNEVLSALQGGFSWPHDFDSNSAVEEFFNLAIDDPNREYIWQRYNIYELVCDYVRRRVESEASNMSSLELGLTHATEFISSNTDKTIRTKISEHVELELLFRIFEAGNGRMIKGVRCAIMGASALHEGIVLNVDVPENLVRGLIATVDCYGLGVHKVPLIALIIDSANYPQEIPQIKDMLVYKYIYSINTKINRQYEVMVGDIRSEEANVANQKRSIATSEARIKQYKSILASKEKFSIDQASLKAMFVKIKKNKKVKEAFLNTDGRVVVITKPLFYIQNGKVTKKEIGRFMFVFDMNYINENGIRAYNLDYGYYGSEEEEEEYVENYHMNVNSDGGVCMGDQHLDFLNLLKQFEIYLLTDYLIEFLSIEHSETANPYISAQTFFEHKKPLQEPIKIPEPLRL